MIIKVQDLSAIELCINIRAGDKASAVELASRVQRLMEDGECMPGSAVYRVRKRLDTTPECKALEIQEWEIQEWD